MVAARHADLGERPAADLPAEHERADARQVGLVGQDQQVEHQPAVLLERVRDAGRLLDDRDLAVALPLGHLDAPLDVPHRVEILGQLALVAVAEAAADGVGLVGHEIEDAAVLAEPGQSRLDVRAVGGPEQALEHRARVVLHRQRRRRRAPSDGVRIGATVTLVARPEHLHRVDGELERRELRLVAEGAGGNLIHRDAGADVGALGLLDVHAGQPCRSGARVVSHALALARDGDLVGQPAQHVDPLAHRRQRLQDGGQLQRLARSRRRPRPHFDPVRHVDGPEAPHRVGGRVAGRREGRDHAVEQRQGQRGAEAAQNRSPGEGLLRDHHLRVLCDRVRLLARKSSPRGSAFRPAGPLQESVPFYGPASRAAAPASDALRIRNGSLSTIPRTSDDQR